jgi:hypothetical protein
MPLMMIGLHERATPEHAGFIPSFLDENDKRPASEQFDERYISGWRPQEGFKLNEGDMSLRYPGDPVMKPILAIIFREELILMYPHEYVAIVQKDGSFEACRMD